MNVYPFIEAEKAGKHNVKRACELLQVSRSAYYQQKSGVRSVRERVDAQLIDRITAVHTVSKGTYGAPRVHADLAEDGMRHGRKRIARLMRAAGLAGKSPRRWRATTIADPNAGIRPDLVGRDFGVDATAVDTRWCGDITYINTWHGWLYLATVIDLASRRIVGWAVADHLKTDLVDAALSDALTRRRPPSGLVFHSDRGCPIHQRPARPPRRHPRGSPVGRPSRAMLGQRRRRVVLLHHQDRAAAPAALAHPHRRPTGTIRIHRRLVQHPPQALDPGLPQPRRPRSHPPRGPTTNTSSRLNHSLNSAAGRGTGRRRGSSTARRAGPARPGPRRSEVG